MENDIAVRRALLNLIQSSPRPLTFKDLRDAYKGPKATLEELRHVLGILVTAGAVQPCANFRFWHRDERELHLQSAREIVRQRPRTKAELVRELGKLDTGATEAWREAIFETLRAEPGMYLLPGLGDSRVCRISTQPPRLEDYIERAKLEFRKALKTLTSLGFTEAEVVQAVCGVSPLSSGGSGKEVRRELRAPESDADLDFQRDASELLVYAWQDAATTEAKALIEDTLHSLGLDPVGSPGEVVDYDGRFQHTEATLKPGQRVQVLQSGWELRNSRGAYLIAKARVQPCAN